MGMHFDPFRGNGGEDIWQSASNIVKAARAHSQRMLDINDAKVRRDHTIPLDPAAASDVRMLSIASAFSLQYVMVARTCDMLDGLIAKRDPMVLQMVALLVDGAWEAAKLDSLLPPDYVRNKAKE